MTDWIDSYEMIRPLGEGKYLVIWDLIFGKRIAVATREGVGEHWCFTTRPDAAMLSFLMWPLPPFGWSRHMLPDGSFEYPEGEHDEDQTASV